MESYATKEELTAFLVGGDYEDQTPEGDQAERILARASELIRWATVGTYDQAEDYDPEAPPATVVEALRDATCAQVEQWLEIGEETDIGGWDRTQGVKYGTITIDSLPSLLAPRAYRILASEGILNDAGQAAAGEAAPAQPIGVDII